MVTYTASTDLSLSAPGLRFSILQGMATAPSVSPETNTGAGKQCLDITLMKKLYIVRNTLKKGSERLFLLLSATED